MKSSEVLLIVVGAAAIGGGAYFLATRNKAPAPGTQQPYQYQAPAPTMVIGPAVPTQPSQAQPVRPPAPASPLAGVQNLVRDVSSIVNFGKDIFAGIGGLFR